MARILGWCLLTIVLLFAASFLATRLSPWPDVWLLRHVSLVLGDQGAKSAAALARHVPPGVESHLDVSYDSDDADGRMDVFFPSHAGAAQATIVWVHGGAFVAGTKSDIRPYLAILASHGYTAVGIEYSKAPERTYPTPVLQLGKALAYLQSNAATFHVDPSRFVLAGDSAGAQIAAQMALVISNASYASATRLTAPMQPDQLRGVLLFCGPYDLSLIPREGKFANLTQKLLWSYFGQKDFEKSPGYKYFSVVDFVTARFPPSFISAGNTDPLLEHSEHLVQALRRAGATPRVLFFEHAGVPVPHEYQFDLDTPAGKQALGLVLGRLSDWTASPEP
ncbi:alpha/beta hydrolase [Rhodanobacter koreensis]